MKLLLYCTKAKPYLSFYRGCCRDEYVLDNEDRGGILNGKIVAECDFEVEEITPNNWNAETEHRILKGSCLKEHQLFHYIIKGDENESQNPFYAIHIKNLHIFDKPKELSDYYTNRIFTKIEDVYTDEIQIKGSEWVRPINQAPQNMCYAFDVKSFNEIEKYILISIRPEWLCKILNGEKKIEVRKKVLKEMLK